MQGFLRSTRSYVVWSSAACATRTSCGRSGLSDQKARRTAAKSTARRQGVTQAFEVAYGLSSRALRYFNLCYTLHQIGRVLIAIVFDGDTLHRSISGRR